MIKKKRWAGILLVIMLLAFLSFGLAASSGNAGITFVEDDSVSSSSQGEPSRASANGGAAKRDGDSFQAEREYDSPDSGNQVSIFDPQLPLAALGPLPTTGSNHMSLLLNFFGVAFAGPAFVLIMRGAVGGKRSEKAEGKASNKG